MSAIGLSVTDTEGNALACRVHVANSARQAQRAAELPFFHDHFVCPGEASIELEPRGYEIVVERGPEYERHRQVIQLANGATRKIEVTLRRIADLRKRGWYSADLHVHRPPEDIELLMRAEDLDFAPVITWWNNRNLWSDRELPAETLVRFDGHRLYHLMAGEDEREGGALLYFGLVRPLAITGASREVPSPLEFAEAAIGEKPDVWIDIEKPFWWDVPTWLASGKVRSIGIANNHMCRAQMYEDEAWGRPRDEERLPAPRGNGYWTQEIYYHALNAGLRIPPSAGSASGVLPNPVGYNRVYVHVGDAFTHDNWWRALSAGKCFVTNGPLVECRAGGELPGHVFSAPDKDALTVPLEVSLTSVDRVRQLEVIHNGKVVKTIDCGEAVAQDLRADVEISESGWFLVRAIAEADETFRFGSTGPYHVELGPKRQHVSRASCEFFRKWVEERIARVTANVEAEADRANVLQYHERALEFWGERLAGANAP
jgi:hypothetical protein